MNPAVKVFVLAAFATFEARIAALEKQFSQLTAQLQAKSSKVTPDNSSVPPSTVHPHNDKDKPGIKNTKIKT